MDYKTLTDDQILNQLNGQQSPKKPVGQLSDDELLSELNGGASASFSVDGGPAQKTTVEQPKQPKATQANVGGGILGTMGDIASGAWEAFKETNVLPMKDFRGNTFKVKDIPTVAGNAVGEVGDFINFVQDPMGSETVQGMKQLPAAVAKDPVGVGKAMGKGFVEDTLMGGIGAVKRDPLQSTALVGKLPAIAKKGAGILGNMTKTGSRKMLSTLSGVPEELLSDVAGQRRLGKDSPGMEAFDEGLKRSTPEELASNVQKVVADELPQKASENWDKAFRDLRAPKDGINVKQVWDDLGVVLKDQRIFLGEKGFDFSRSDFRARPDLQKKITEMVLTLNDMDGRDVRDIHSALKAAYRVIDTLPIDDRSSRRALSEIWGHYRDTVGKQIPGFNKMQSEFSLTQKALDGYRFQLFGNASQGKLQQTAQNGAINKSLVAALDHLWSPNANRTVQREFVDKLSVDIKNQLGEDFDIKRVAGGLRVASGTRTRFGTTLDMLLSGNGLMAGFQGDIGTAAASIFGAILSAATVQNPRVAAGIARTFGASEGVVDEIRRRTQTIKDAANKAGINSENLSIGSALTIMGGEAQSQGGLLGAIRQPPMDINDRAILGALQ